MENENSNKIYYIIPMRFLVLYLLLTISNYGLANEKVPLDTGIVEDNGFLSCEPACKGDCTANDEDPRVMCEYFDATGASLGYLFEAWNGRRWLEFESNGQGYRLDRMGELQPNGKVDLVLRFFGKGKGKGSLDFLRQFFLEEIPVNDNRVDDPEGSAKNDFRFL